MINKGLVVDLGLMEFMECWAMQHRIHRARIEGQLPDCLLLVEHPHVFTSGRRGRPENLLIPEPVLREQGIPCLTIERGGDWTYHGPGQLVGYPIFTLRGRNMGIVDFVERIEEVMILILREYGIDGGRNERNRGVWVGESKIGFVGIAVRKGVTFHGFSLNCCPDLSFFRMINPCGMKDVDVTSIGEILGREVQMKEVKDRAVFFFQKVFDISFEKVKIESLLNGEIPIEDEMIM